MRKNVSVHWVSPTIASASLICGVLFAVAHHLFYVSLAGTVAADANNGYNLYFANVSGQTLNIAIGTLFAFLVKACLIVPITTAYIQLFWRGLVLRTHDIDLKSLDSTFAGIANYFTFFRGRIWRRHPFLFLIALSTWLLPLAAIITPATLSVVSRPMSPPPRDLRQVPTPGFVSLNFLAPMTPEDQNSLGGTPLSASTYYNNGPSIAISNIAREVAYQGQILPLQAPGVNSSWSVEFAAPTLQCSSIDGSDLEAIERSFRAQYSHTQTLYPYLAWTYQWSTYGFSNDSITPSDPLLPFRKSGNSYPGYEVNPAKLNHNVRKPSVIYFAIFSNASTAASPTDQDSSGSTFIKCSMFNSTLHIDFTFINAEQSVESAVTNISDDVVMGVHSVVWNRPGASCYPVFRALQDEPCTLDEDLPSTLSYQAIFEAFSNLVSGSINVGYEALSVADTNIVETVLINLPEMRVPKSGLYTQTLQENLQRSNGSLFRGFGRAPWPPGQESQPLARALETLFRNVVISSMTTKSLLADPDSQFSPPPTNVTFHTYHNIYLYSAPKLWIAYGVAIAVAFIVCLVGFGIMLADRATYSFNFSSVFRFAKGAAIDPMVRHEDTSARDPLPKYLAKAKIKPGMGQGGQKVHKELQSKASAPLLDNLPRNGRPTSSVTI